MNIPDYDLIGHYQNQLQSQFNEKPRVFHIILQAIIKIDSQIINDALVAVTEHMISFFQKKIFKRFVLIANFHQQMIQAIEIIDKTTVQFKNNNQTITIESQNVLELVKIFIRNYIFSIYDLHNIQIISQIYINSYPICSPVLTPSQKFQFSFSSFCSFFHQKYNHKIVRYIHDFFTIGNPILDLSFMRLPIIDENPLILQPLFLSLIKESNIRGVQCFNMNIPSLLQNMSDFFNQNKSVTILSVPNCNIQTGGKALGLSFKNNHDIKLKYLDLSCNQISDISDLVESLKYLQSGLFYLNLNDISLNQKDTAILFDNIIKNQNLHELTHLLINKTTINSQILDSFSYHITSPKFNIKHLELGPISDASIKLLFQNLNNNETQLEVLKIAGSHFDNDSVSHFVTFLVSSPCLKELDISKTNLNIEEIGCAITAIHHNQNITSIKLHLNYMNLHGRNLLSFIKKIKEFDLNKWTGFGLEGNEMSSADLRSLMSLFVDMKNLSWLNLSCNFSPSTVGLDDEICNILNIQKLDFIELRGNLQIDFNGKSVKKEPCMKSKSYISNQTLLKFISGIEKLKRPIGIDLRYNCIDDPTILRLCKIISMNKINKLLLDCDKISKYQTLISLCQSVSESKSIIFFNFPLIDYHFISKAYQSKIDKSRKDALKNVMKNQINSAYHSVLSFQNIRKLDELINDSIIEMNNNVKRPFKHSIFSEIIGLLYPFQYKIDCENEINKMKKYQENDLNEFYDIPDIIIEEASSGSSIFYEKLCSKKQEAACSCKNQQDSKKKEIVSPSSEKTTPIPKNSLINNNTLNQKNDNSNTKKNINNNSQNNCITSKHNDINNNNNYNNNNINNNNNSHNSNNNNNSSNNNNNNNNNSHNNNNNNNSSSSSSNNNNNNNNNIKENNINNKSKNTKNRNYNKNTSNTNSNFENDDITIKTSSKTNYEFSKRKKNSIAPIWSDFMKSMLLANKTSKEVKFDLDDFIFLSIIGQGSFGQVYKVKLKGIDMFFAAKVTLDPIIDDVDELFTNLSREVSLLEKMNHPGIIRFLFYSPINNNNEPKPVIITEYASNGTLEDLIKEAREGKTKLLNDTQIMIIIYGIASAMKYLHSHDILHRDLKPANILLDDLMYPKISDFGISKIENSKLTSSLSTYVKGTPIYIAPEIFEECEYTKAGDVYAFSIILYEIITLKEAYKGFNANQLYKYVVINSQRPQFNVPIPEVYKNLIERCWSQNPKNRPTFDEIATQLRTDPRFISDSVDIQKYNKYIYYLDKNQVYYDASNNSHIEVGHIEEKKVEFISIPHLKFYPIREYIKLKKEESHKLVHDAETQPDKQFELAQNLIKSLNEFSVNSQLGITYLKKAIDGGCTQAIKYYCKMLIKGKVIPKNHKKAHKIIEKHFDKNNIGMFHYLLGKMQLVEKNYTKAIQYFVLIPNGPFLAFCDNDCMYEYAKMLYYGIGVEKNELKALKVFSMGAKSKHAKSIMQIAMHLTLNKDFFNAVDYFKAASDLGSAKSLFLHARLIEFLVHEGYEQYYKMAAEKGHVESMIDYSRWLLKRKDLDKNDEIKAHFLKKASDRGKIGDIRAIYLYASVLFRKKDFKECIKYMKLAADSGIIDAILGYCYALSSGANGIIFNKDEIIKYYKIAIDKGCDKAYGCLATFLDQCCYDPDTEEIIKYYEIGVSKGDDDAMNNYAYMLQHGHHGVKVDIDRAIDLYKKAIEKGNSAAKNNLAIIISCGIGGVEEDDEKVRQYYKVGAEKGVPASMYNYATILIRGNKDEKKEAIYYFQKAADADDVESILAYGKLLMKGGDVEQDIKKAEKYFKKGADLGCKECMYHYGKMLYDSNKKEAAKYFKCSADQGYINAITKYAKMLHTGDGIPIDIDKAAKYYQKAISKGSISAKQNYEQMLKSDKNKDSKCEENSIEYYKTRAQEGDPEAMNKYAVFLLKNSDDDDRINEGIRYLKESADKGCSDSMARYASFLYEGNGVPVNIEESMKYFKKAADLGEVIPMANYAFYMLQNESIPNHYEIAAKYYKMAVDKGEKRSMLRYGELLAEGKGVPENKPEALKYFKMAGENGETTGFNNYAFMLYNGIGVPVDRKEGIKYFKIAADQGDIDAILNYIDILLESGRTENQKLAAKYCEVAARKGSPAAMHKMGDFYNDGIGVEADDKKAGMFYKMAADKGYAPSIATYGAMLYFGSNGAPQDREKAEFYFELAKRKNVLIHINDEAE